jgi:adenosylmethionine-8-amino-7-oxononanoate aminotransferase
MMGGSFLRKTVRLGRHQGSRRHPELHPGAVSEGAGRRRCLTSACDDADEDAKTAKELGARVKFVAENARTRETLTHLQADRTSLWHPYTSLTRQAPPTPVLPVASAQGCRITLEDGSVMVDGMASWWSAVHGYRHPRLDAAVKDQLARMSHIMFGGLTHRPAVTLAELLVEVTPKALTKVFLADSGSVSVEVALKMALQYHRGRGLVGKTQFVALESGYHGDTFGAMSVCDPLNGMHSAFSNNLMSNHFLPRPPCDPEYSLMEQAPGGCKGCNCHRSGAVDSYEQALEKSYRAMEDTLETHADSIAAVIVEPLVQGAGGMRFYDQLYLQRLRAACTAHNILLIADEIATGFGRSGLALFACQEAGIEPDIMCVGKALTAGYMTLAACLATEEVAEAVSASSDAAVPALPLMHGPTFMGNSLACAVAAESLLMLMEETQDGGGVFYREAIQRIEEHLRKVLQPVAALDTVADVRVRGGIGVIERREPVDMAAATRVCSERGAWLRPFGRLVYTMPPYIASAEDLDIISEAMLDVAKL